MTEDRLKNYAKIKAERRQLMSLLRCTRDGMQTDGVLTAVGMLRITDKTEQKELAGLNTTKARIALVAALGWTDKGGWTSNDSKQIERSLD